MKVGDLVKTVRHRSGCWAGSLGLVVETRERVTRNGYIYPVVDVYMLSKSKKGIQRVFTPDDLEVLEVTSS